MSQITTHVLDTAKGKPAAGVPATLQKSTGQDHWETIATGTTNADGRIPDLLPKEIIVAPGTYRIVFDTKSYFEAKKSKSFYPSVSVVFETVDSGLYHVPLLLSPFGYSTYRGS